MSSVRYVTYVTGLYRSLPLRGERRWQSQPSLLDFPTAPKAGIHASDYFLHHNVIPAKAGIQLLFHLRVFAKYNNVWQPHPLGMGMVANAILQLNKYPPKSLP